MTDVVALEIPAEPSFLTVARMVVGGMAARVDLSVDEIEDVYLALEAVFYATQEKGCERRCTLRVRAVEGALFMELGPFDSPSLERRLAEPECWLVSRVVAFELRRGDDGSSTIVLTKRREVSGS